MTCHDVVNLIKTGTFTMRIKTLFQDIQFYDDVENESEVFGNL